MSGAVNALCADTEAAEYHVPKVRHPRVAVIDFDNGVDLKKLEIRLLELAKNNNIDGILLSINHNGGTGDVAVIHDMILRVKRIKPVVGLIRGAAYSAGYHVASATDYLIAHTFSGVGSIGSYCEFERRNGELTIDQNGFKSLATVYVFTAGKYKGLHLRSKNDLSDDEKAYIQKEVDKDYQAFLAAVAKNRGLDVARSDDWAEGKIFIPSEALELGLIDEIGTAFEAESKLVDLMRKKYSNIIISSNVEYVY